MQKWEYSIEDFEHLIYDDIYLVQNKLCEWGKEGWELVAVYFIDEKINPITRVFLKRPLA